jgi:hypothetical protein
MEYINRESTLNPKIFEKLDEIDQQKRLRKK